MVDEALRQLCTGPKTFLGAFAMICLILGVLLHIANYFLNSGRPKTSKKPLLWLAGTWIIVICVLCIVIYVVSPLIARALLGPGNPSDPCGQYDPYYVSANYTPSPPYCGGYCQNKSIPKEHQNCTCSYPLQEALGGVP